MNPLDTMPRTRRAVYHVYWVLGVILGALMVAYATADGDAPDWLAVYAAVYGFLAAPIGYTAASNVANRPTPED